MFISCSRCNAILFKLFVTGLHCVCFLYAIIVLGSISHISSPFRSKHIITFISHATVYASHLPSLTFHSNFHSIQPSNMDGHTHLSLVPFINQTHTRIHKTQICKKNHQSTRATSQSRSPAHTHNTYSCTHSSDIQWKTEAEMDGLCQPRYESHRNDERRVVQAN